MQPFVPQSLRRFRRESDGTSAIEFAIILPVMILFFLGALTAFDGYKASRTLTHLDSTMADLISRQVEITNAFEDDLVQVATALSGKYQGNMQIQVTAASVYRPLSDPIDPSGVNQSVNVDWFMSRDLEGNTGTQTAQALIEGLDIPLLTPGDSVIIVEIAGLYDPLFDGQFITNVPMRRIAIRRPRFTQRVVTAPGYTPSS
ncbi:TadE/TadG family type IV pilus assembly protein [Parvularcula sp. LCG005]|uniref:TadE/TadG family type IV pilus assembly protein n=1 Tax=Parvularcula sp. LCG005 TaxID=3078805 RepID=UPI002941CD5D|nr:TadE/TadG family type IV pilus assembly protein [Parvularcula sp. LCG005]WOI54025.1 TadE/TadG family type IV pilus assembly protein [Parvularcula sp. LCG005]